MICDADVIIVFPVQLHCFCFWFFRNAHSFFHSLISHTKFNIRSLVNHLRTRARTHTHIWTLNFKFRWKKLFGVKYLKQHFKKEHSNTMNVNVNLNTYILMLHLKLKIHKQCSFLEMERHPHPYKKYINKKMKHLKQRNNVSKQRGEKIRGTIFILHTQRRTCIRKYPNPPTYPHPSAHTRYTYCV